MEKNITSLTIIPCVIQLMITRKKCMSCEINNEGHYTSLMCRPPKLHFAISISFNSISLQSFLSMNNYSKQNLV